MALLDVEQLNVDFRTSSGKFRAVDNVDIQVDEGEVLAIVGESGSGKSVSMLAIMGLLPWTADINSNKMEINGVDMSRADAKVRREIIGRDIAMIFQEPMSSLNPCFTIGFQLKEALKSHLALSRSERHRRAIELLEQVGMPEPERRLRAFPHQLSGGMCQSNDCDGDCL